jgi:flagellar hook-basal body complex protein FliE
MTVSPFPIAPSAVAQAYRSVDGGTSSSSTVSGNGQDFGSTLQRAVEGAVKAGTNADQQSALAIQGHGNITDVVTAVSKAELALQTTVALRDRIVQAYSEIMKMPI